MTAVVESSAAAAVLAALVDRGGAVPEDELTDFLAGLRAPWETLEALIAGGDLAAVTVERRQVVALTQRGMHRANAGAVAT